MSGQDPGAECIDVSILRRDDIERELVDLQGREQAVYLDGLDQTAIHDPSVLRWLASRLTAPRFAGISWRLACRSVAWERSLADALRRSRGRFEEWKLLPLDRETAQLAVAAHFKTLLETGWYESQPLLGAPAGQVYHDFPTADNLNFAAGSVLGALLGDWAVAMNVYYVVGFLLCAVGGLFFLLRVGVSRPVGVALSVLFALAPYHFVRNENHLWLSSYFFLPIALWVVWLVATGRPVWLARAGARDGAVPRRRADL